MTGANPALVRAVAAVVLVGLVGAACGGGESGGGSDGASGSDGRGTFGGIVLRDIDPAEIAGREPTASFSTPAMAARAEVRRVVDGDTIIATFEGGRSENVRLIGIDTPEKPGGRLPAECFGAEAGAFVAALLPPGSAVLLTGGAENRDVYDRLLAYVHRAGDGLFVNMALAREGYAVALSIPPNNDYSAHFEAAVAAARRENLGLWATCGGADTPLPE